MIPGSGLPVLAGSAISEGPNLGPLNPHINAIAQQETTLEYPGGRSAAVLRCCDVKIFGMALWIRVSRVDLSRGTVGGRV